jgi:CubicO group peptidase (beta-lactamase class C family)
MERVIGIRAAQVLFVLLLATSVAAQESARVDQVVQSFVPNRFMGAVLVAMGDRILLNKGYGSANLEWEIPNTPTTKFRLASITKQFTAAGILLLEERGRLSVNDPVRKYLPGTPAAWDRITIFHLLTHTAGIPNYTSFPDSESSSRSRVTSSQLVERFLDKPLEFEPGDKYSYSNSGYAVLGYLIEAITGQTYAEFVTQNIFTPLGMSGSGYDVASTLLTHRASGYTGSPRGPANAAFIDMTTAYASGGLYSTTDDLLLESSALRWSAAFDHLADQDDNTVQERRRVRDHQHVPEPTPAIRTWRQH